MDTQAEHNIIALFTGRWLVEDSWKQRSRSDSSYQESQARSLLGQ